MVKDIKNLPATRDLVTFMSAHVLGGYETGESAVWKSAKVFNSVCLFGLPI